MAEARTTTAAAGATTLPRVEVTLVSFDGSAKQHDDTLPVEHADSPTGGSNDTLPVAGADATLPVAAPPFIGADDPLRLLRREVYPSAVERGSKSK